jgi:hypothetical protein
VLGRYDTGFIDRHRADLLVAAPTPPEARDAIAVALALAAARIERGSNETRPDSAPALSPWVSHHRARLSSSGEG